MTQVLPPTLSVEFDAIVPGTEFVTRGRTITESDVVQFAALTGDWHPQHADAEFARTTIFGGRIAHGLLVLSYALGLVPIDPDRVVALRRIVDAKFRAPVRLGDTIKVEGRVVAVRPLDARLGSVTFLWRVVNQHGGACVIARVEVLWRRGPVETPDPDRADEVDLVCPPL